MPCQASPAVHRNCTQVSSRAPCNHAVANAITETLWIRYILAEPDIVLTKLVKVLCVSIGATYITANPVLHYQNKHVKVVVRE